MNGSRNFVQHAEVAKSFHSDSPARVEADNSAQVDMALAMAQRAANPSSRPPEAQPPPAPEKKPVMIVMHLS